MTSTFVIRRLLIAVDASAAARAALTAAMRLAKELQTEAEGVFVEDERLLSICGFEGLPVAHINAATGRAEPVSAPSMEAGLRAQANTLKIELATIAAAHQHVCRLRAVRGPVAGTLIAESRPGDLLVVGRRAPHVGAVLEETIRRARTHVLVLPGHKDIAGACAILARDAAMLEVALDAAVRTSYRDRRPVDVWFGPGLQPADIRSIEANRGAEFRSVSPAPANPEALALALSLDCGLLVLSGDDPMLAESGLRSFLAHVATPTLLVRDPPKDD